MLENQVEDLVGDRCWIWSWMLKNQVEDLVGDRCWIWSWKLENLVEDLVVLVDRLLEEEHHIFVHHNHI